MPSVFVPGPSANPNIGSPAQYLSNISQLANSFREDSRARETLEQDKLFKQSTIDLNERKQAFTEAEPQRAEDQRLSNLAIEVDKLNTIKNYAEGAQYAGVDDRFDTIDSTLMKNPRYAQLDEPGKQAARNEYILKNPSALTHPKQFVDTLRAGLIQSEKFSGPELEAALEQEVKRRYPTTDPSIIKELLLKPKDLIGSGNTSISIGEGQRSSGSGSFDFVSDPINQKDKNTLLKEEFELLGLTDKSTGSTLGVRHELSGLPVIGKLFAKNVTHQSYSKAVSKLENVGLSVPEAISVLRQQIDGDLETSMNFDDLSSADVKKLEDAAAGNRAQQTQIFNKKGGGVSAAGSAAGVNSPAGAVAAAQEYNNALLANLTPRAKDDSEIISSFLDSLGAAPNQAPPLDTSQQGGNQGGSPGVTPAVVPQPAVIPDTTSNIVNSEQAKIVVNSKTAPKTSIFSKGDKVALADAKAELKSLESRSNVGSVERRRAELTHIIDTLESNEKLKELSDKIFKETGGTIKLKAKEKPSGATTLFDNITNALR